MQIKNECLPCMVKALVKLAEKVTDDKALQEDIITYGIRCMGADPFKASAPYITAQIYEYAKKKSGKTDPYLQEKKVFNLIADKLIQVLDLKKLIIKSHDPLETAVRLAIAGNIIDYSLGNDVDENSVRLSVEESLSADLFGMDMSEFKRDIENAKRIMIIGDNAGEIVFDKLLVEMLPQEKVVYAVKGGAIVNDATMQDAVSTEMTHLVKVVENGASIQGTILEHCSEAFVKLFADSDLIISKGQANFETLDGQKDKNIYFFTQSQV